MDTTVADPLLGRALDGRYRVDRRIARGGMATVYEAFDTRLDRAVAVKVMHPALADDDDFVERFHREAKAAARLSHPNVVAVFDQGEDDGRVFLVMEYVAGRTLRDLLSERSRLSPAQSVSILEQVLGALAAAHRAGLVHRDVKPENVLLADDGRVKVADFGLVRAIEASHVTTATGLLIGTVAYLAPEQVATGAADPRTDVYAAGVLLWEMLVGHPPYAAESPLAVAYKHVNSDVPAPSTAAPDVPPALDTLVVRCTRRDPAARPADGTAFLTALRGVTAGAATTSAAITSAALTSAATQSGRPPHDPDGDTVVVHRSDPDTRPTVLTGPTRRRRRGLIVTFVLAALVVLAIVAGWWLGSGRYIAAPSLLGQDRALAEATAARDGVSVRFASPGFSETVPVGLVTGQRPTPTGRVLRHGTVTAVLSKGPERYPVPAVAGKTVGEATTALTATHLRVGGSVQRYDDMAPAGTVLATDPSTGTALRPDTAVALVISKGLEPEAVPDVRNLPLDRARSALTKAKLTVATQDAFDDTVPAGAVASQSPGAGSTAGKGSPVMLTVSKGPEMVGVPDVTGDSVSDAQAALVAAGLKARVIALPIGPGVVRSQDPGRGGQARKGSSVTLFVY